MKLREKLIYTALVLAVIFWLLYSVKSILAPFICSLIISYFLDPLVDYLVTKHHMKRLKATTLILALFSALFISFCLLLLPIIYSQSIALIEAVPEYVHTITIDSYPKIAAFLNKFGFNLDQDFSHVMQKEQMTARVIDFSRNLLGNAISSSAVVINILALIFVTPILIFYLLNDWDVMVEKISTYLPRSVAAQIKQVTKEIDTTMSGYIRGQFNVCLILGITYATLLSFTGLNFGFLIGLLTGLLSFIPYLGMLTGVTIAIVVALFQWGFDATHISAVAIVFFLGQILESNFLTPKLIGSKIGLHPVWLIFGLFFFGTLFGFVGVLIAVPLTAICGVIIKYLALEYKKKYV